MVVSACTSTRGPVTIRETGAPPLIESTTDSGAKPQVAIVQPVVPDKQKSLLPLVESRVVQANNELQRKRYEQAINLAEQGLRIDRKEPRLYLVLAQAYQSLANKQQAVYFAKQGLRYAQKNTPVFDKLFVLSKS
jgi:tetratricopeptide (TPR) repeat protein